MIKNLEKKIEVFMDYYEGELTSYGFDGKVRIKYETINKENQSVEFIDDTDTGRIYFKKAISHYSPISIDIDTVDIF